MPSQKQKKGTKTTSAKEDKGLIAAVHKPLSSTPAAPIHEEQRILFIGSAEESKRIQKLMTLTEDGSFILVPPAHEPMLPHLPDNHAYRMIIVDYSSAQAKDILENSDTAEKWAALPVILLSDTPEETTRKMLGFTMLACVPKEGITPELLKQVIHNLLKQQQMNEELIKLRKLASHLSYHDTLTNMANRQLFQDRLRHELARSRRHGREVGLVLLDLDRFKIANDALGPMLGDRILQESARRLAYCIRECDTVARLGGDEFAIILGDIANPKDVSKVSQRVIDAFNKPFQLEEKEVFVGASLGISLYPHDAMEPDQLLKNADLAMYRAKSKGGGQFQYYSASMNADLMERMELESYLRRALEKDELFLEYQPEWDVKTRSMTGAEVLVRWKHPTRGLMGPKLFIPIAEECGLIHQLGEWIFRKAFQEIRDFKYSDDFSFSINLSARQFRKDGLLDIITTELEAAGINPHRIILEITESTTMQNPDHAVTTLHTLREMGVKVAVDDFGVGYSSLSHLRCIPLDQLKIDRSFVADLSESESDLTIVRAMIAMAHGLGLYVVAEGVETQKQFDLLTTLGCDALQGYFFSKPMSMDALKKFLKEHAQWPATSSTSP